MKQELGDIKTINRYREAAVIGLTCLTGWLFTYVAISVIEQYALALFILLPFALGALSTLLYGYKNPVERKNLRNLSYLTLIIYCFGLLLFAWEGIICLIMSAPLGVLFTWIGHLIGYAILKDSMKSTPLAILVTTVSLPSLMAFENLQESKEQLRSVITSIEIKASPKEVWNNVVSFPELKEPTEFIFKTGIAYPINATINGKGVGAVRLCNFSTGSFVEPISVWEEPKLLAFSVMSQPEPMKELSFYEVHPKHLYGYWVSKKGQFKLTQLPNGNTLLEGTTWYVNKILPHFYWTLWSDYIVHKIHYRVLEHIKEETESKMDKRAETNSISKLTSSFPK